MLFGCRVAYALAIVWLIAGCGGGSTPGSPVGGRETLTADLTLPETLIQGQLADWQVAVAGGAAPYTVVWELGGGAIGTVTDATSGSFTMTGDAWQTRQYQYRVTITDATGHSLVLTGTYEVLPKAGAPHALSILVPPVMRGAADAVWRVQWQGDSPDCRIGWRMNGGALDVFEGTAASGFRQDVQQFAMVNSSAVSRTRTAEVKVIDADGYYVVGSLDYTVEPAVMEQEPGQPGQPGQPGGDLPPADDPSPGNTDPEFVSMVFDAATWDLTVEVNDAEDGAGGLPVTLETPGAFIPDGDGVEYSDAGGRIVFHLIPRDLFSDATGKVKLTVTDAAGGSGQAETVVLINALRLELGTLYAIPLTRNARVGDTVRVVVATGPLHDHLAFLNGVAVRTRLGAEYIPLSLNVGEPGGWATDVDGFWKALNPSGFLQPKEELVAGEALGDGQVFWGFNVTPFEPQAYDFARGALFNFEMTFTAPGEYKLEFLKSLKVDRTLYSDLICIERHWDDISNEYPGFWNTVVVTE